MTNTRNHENSKVLRERVDYPRKENEPHLKEEYAAELTSPLGVSIHEKQEVKDEEETLMVNLTSHRIGYLGLAVSFISLFVWSFVLATIGIVLGYYAYAEGRRTTGGWAIGIGIASLISYTFLVIFTYYQ